MNCWLWFSCMKHWEAAGKNDATYEKDVLAPMSVNCCNFPGPRFWMCESQGLSEKPKPVFSRLPKLPSLEGNLKG